MKAIIGQSGLMQPAGLGGLRVPQPTGLGSVGLGAPFYVGTFCPSFADGIDALQALVAEAERVKATDSVEFKQAKARLERETSWLSYSRSDPLLPATCTKVTTEVWGLVKALAPKVTAVGGSAPMNPAPPGDDSGLIKFAIVGGIVVVGLGALAYITGQVAPFFRALKR